MSAERRAVIAAQLGAASEACAREGARLTELRHRVLGLILEADGPVTAYQLLDRLKETRRGAAPPTIYRALDFLISQRLIHKLERLNAFVPCIETGHEHAAQFLICRQCGTVTEIDDHAAANALEHAAEREGFHPRRAIVEIEGTCALCFHP
ncbi:MAG TPA: Fur family transcriptional regulator [Stellaceae bacterium]|nr:Fur family transcriptional regulator [Stellaceae bacterium]